MNGKEAILAMFEEKTVTCAGVRWRWNDGFLRDDEPGGFCGNRTYEVVEPPNPHQKGTFAWAYEETKRGRLVRRPGRYTLYLESQTVLQSDAVATDWELA